MAGGGGDAGLPSGCSCDSPLGVPGEAGHPCGYLSPLLHVSVRVMFTVTYCTGQRAGTQMKQIYVNSVNPFPQVTAHGHSGVSAALPHG